MYRYIAIAWNHRIEERRLLATKCARKLMKTFPEWECVYAIDGLHVYQSLQGSESGRSYLLSDQSGVVLGTLFTRCADAEHPLAGFDHRASDLIRRTEGRYLTERYWGRYVALLRTDDGGPIRILRDPTGAMPCHLIPFQCIHVVCSHLADAARLGLVDVSINWNHVVAFLWFHRLVTAASGLHGVSRLHAGECVTIHPDRTESMFYWSPDRVYSARAVGDVPHAMRELRAVIQYCVRAWASCYDGILHELSGGLDSAIVLSCLANSSVQPKVVAQNYYTASPEGDERAYARIAAARAGIELRETPLRSVDSLDEIFTSEKVASPVLTSLPFDNAFRWAKPVKERRLDAVFSGQGGDHLFQRASTVLIAAEYASRRGLQRFLFKVIADTARFTEMPVWSVLGSVLRSRLFRRREDPYAERLKPPPFMNKAARDALDLSCIRHPWIESAVHLPGSKILQILNIVDSQNFYRVSSSLADIVHPLISQPIIEQCIQTPTYILTYGGIDRALVRDAFIGLVPSEITNRTSKGGTTSHVHNELTTNLPFIREALLDGALVRQNILDRQALESGLTESSLIRNPNLLFPVLNALRAELWSRAWMGEPRATSI